MRVVIAYTPAAEDAPPEELDGLVQRDAVAAALSDLGHEVEALAFGLDLDRIQRELDSLEPDCVFNLVESVAGRDRLLLLAPALFEAFGLAFTGAGQIALLQTTNKLQGKHWLRSAGLPTPAWIEASGRQPAGPVEGQPVIVKSAWDHGSAGLEDDAVATCDDPAGLVARLRRLSDRPGREWFGERFVDGREFNLSVLASPDGPQVLPLAEIRFEGFEPGKPRMVGYRAKWDPDSFEYHHTDRSFDFPPSDDALLERLRALALDCWELFDLKGFARVDFRVDEAGRPWILEVNINPCLSPDAGFAAAVERAGLTYAQAIARIVADAR